MSGFTATMAASRSPKKRVTPSRPNSGRGRRGSGSSATIPAETLALRRQERELRALRNQFHESDHPAFDAWMEACFAQERQEAIQLHEKADELEDLLDEANLAYRSGEFSSLREALAAEMDRAEEEDWDFEEEMEPGASGPDGSMPEEVADFLFAQFMAGARGVDAARMDPAAYAKAKADFMATFEKAQAGDRLGFEKSLLKTGADDSEENVREVKTVYRRLAKRLHPDASGSWEESEKNLWEEASKAYEALDLRGLHQVDLILTLERGEKVPSIRQRELRCLHDELCYRISDLTLELTELRAHPGWEFGKRKKTKAFRGRIQSDLDEAIHAGRMRLKTLETEIRSIVGPKHRSKPKRKPRTKPGTGPIKPKGPGRTRPVEEQTEMPF